MNKYAANPTFHLDISIDLYTSPVNAGADEIRDTAVMVLFQGKGAVSKWQNKPQRQHPFQIHEQFGNLSEIWVQETECSEIRHSKCALGIGF